MLDRSVRIDTLRGLACILLVAYHVVGISPTTGLRLDDSHPVRIVNDAIAYLRMPLFSFLSGYVYASRPYRNDPASFIKGKARRLLVPMLIVGTLLAILQAVTPGTNAKALDWSMLHIVPVAHFWFLESLFLIYVGIVALEHFGALRTERRFAVVLFAAACVHLARPFPVYFGLQGAAYLLPFTLLGIWCNRFGDGRSVKGQLALGLTAVLTATLYVALFAPAMPSTSSVTALAMGGGACITLLRLRPKAQWSAWIGVHSFAIYLFHSMFTAASRIFLTKAGVAYLPTLIGIGIVAGVFLPIATERVLRRFPGLGRLVLGESKGRGNPAGAARPSPSAGEASS